MGRRRAAAVLLSAAAGCGFNPSGEAPGDGGVVDDGGLVPITLRHDALGDFSMPGTVSEALVIEPWGALAPAAYHVGALRAHAANTQRFTEAADASWDDVTDGAPAGTGFLSRSIEGDPVGVGLDSGDSWTLWAEGDLWLDAGETTFVVNADDQGFIEIAPPGGAFVRVLNARFGIGTGTFTAATSGWYPIRLAMNEGFGGSDFEVDLYPNGAALAEPLGPARLRTRVDGLRGSVLAAWDNGFLVGTANRTLATDPLVNASFGNSVPRDVGIGDGERWSLRWSAQFYALVAGTYPVRVQSDDGHRLYVNGALVSDPFDGLTADRNVDVELVQGWNDLVLDLNEQTGDASVRMRVTGGPEPGLAAELPAARLRPLEPRNERLETASNNTDVGIPDSAASPASASLPIVGMLGATVAGADVIVTLNHPRYADLEIRLVHPGGTEVLLRDNSDAGGSGNRSLRFSTDGFEGLPATGTWTVRVTDNANGQSGTLTDVQLAVHLANGPDQIARSAAFTSLVQDLGAVVSIDRVRFGGRAPVPGGIAVRLRTCDAPEQCAAAPWGEAVTDGAGGAPNVEVRRYLQYRVELTSDGEREPELDWLEIDYRVPPS